MVAASALLVALGAGAALLVAPGGSPAGRSCDVVARWGDGGREDARLNHPMGVAWSGGTVYVADAENGAVKLFRDDGTFLAAWKGFERPAAVVAADTLVYVADFLTDRVTKLNRRGVVLTQWGRHGRGFGEFDAPSGVAVDGRGHVYVADFYNHRVQKFDGDGRFLLEWGGRGRWRGRFRYPTGIAASPRNELFVADAYNHRIQKFTTDGRLLGMWGGLRVGLPGSRPGWFRLAKDVAVDPQGTVYVADAFNHRVQRFTADGVLLGGWGEGRRSQSPVRYPAGVAVDRDGFVYVTDFFGNAIWKLGCH